MVATENESIAKSDGMNLTLLSAKLVTLSEYGLSLALLMVGP